MSERNVSDAIESISGKKPSPEDIQRLESIFFNLGFEKGDTFRPFLMVLDYYHGFYSKLPAELNQAADNAASSAASKAQSAVNEAVAKLLPTISKDISKQTNEAISQAQKSQRFSLTLKWFLIFSFSALSLIGFGYFMGVRQTEAKAIASLAWLKTNDGQRVINCSGKGWELKENGLCLPYSQSDGRVWGWFVPAR
jgi:hypothetical protein